jgi:hypothetical protein
MAADRAPGWSIRHSLSMMPVGLSTTAISRGRPTPRAHSPRIKPCTRGVGRPSASPASTSARRPRGASSPVRQGAGRGGPRGAQTPARSRVALLGGRCDGHLHITPGQRTVRPVAIAVRDGAVADPRGPEESCRFLRSTVIPVALVRDGAPGVGGAADPFRRTGETQHRSGRPGHEDHACEHQA